MSWWSIFIAVVCLAPIASGYQPIPYFDETMVLLEGENFTASGNSQWHSREWGSDGGLFASTVANVFHSRRGYINAPANVSPSDIATSKFAISQAGTFSVLARFEHGYRFQSPFNITITDSTGKLIFDRPYGYRENLKVWAFAAGRNGPDGKGGSLCGNQGHSGAGLQAECAWPYGASENLVWEGVGAFATLDAGIYTMSIAGINTTLPGVNSTDFCDRNIDAILLHPNATDIDMRIAHEGPMLPLDGLLTQAGDVFFQVENLDSENWLNITLPFTYIHSPYFTMHMHFPQCSTKPATNTTPAVSPMMI
jgi:hypothetical protein